MTNPIARVVHCPTCGAPPGRACRSLNPEKDDIVPSHSARRVLYERLQPADIRVLGEAARALKCMNRGDE